MRPQVHETTVLPLAIVIAYDPAEVFPVKSTEKARAE